jgi:hypothetical protein
MAEQQGAAITEVSIRISQAEFHVAMHIDGAIRQRQVFATVKQVAAWASLVERTAGEGLYIRMQLQQERDMTMVLQLAYAFHQSGLMTGIILDNPICRCRQKGLH